MDVFMFYVAGYSHRIASGITVLILLLLSYQQVCGQSSGQSISGSVVDAETGAPLPWTTVMLVTSRTGTSCDSLGRFELTDLQPGSYSIRFSLIGYNPLVRNGVIIKPGRDTELQIELIPTAFQDEDMVVDDGYFPSMEDQPLSVTSLNSEEIVRSPGTGGDISRILRAHPSVAKYQDENNGLMVRGGSPVENKAYINNIEIGNINHFPVQGSSGGLYSMLDPVLIEKIDFYTGGFDARFGGQLSSVLDIDLKGGNRNEISGKLESSVGISGFILEGPIRKNRGGWLLSARRSSINFAFELSGVDINVPEFRDILVAADYDISPKNRLSFINLYAVNFWHMDGKDIYENPRKYHGNHDLIRNISGLTWKSIWENDGYSLTSIYYGRDQYTQALRPVSSFFRDIRRNSSEYVIGFRNVNHWRINSSSSLEFGLDFRELIFDYHDYYGSKYTIDRDIKRHVNLLKSFNTEETGLFLSHTARTFGFLTIKTGLRLNHLNYTGRSTLSPRFSLTCNLNAKSRLSFAWGKFFQHLPMVLMAQNETFRDLDHINADHYILGFSYLLTPCMLLNVEAYDKNYHNCPINPQEPEFFVLDQPVIDELFRYNEELVMSGRARTYGIELFLRKKLTGFYYGQMGFSWFRSEYHDLDGIRRDRIYDNRLLFNFELGLKPSAVWDLSLRWVYAGGHPYMQYAHVIGQGIQFDAIRSDSYRTTTIRIDRRLNFSGSSLTLYFSAFNLFNNREVIYSIWRYGYYVDADILQWPRVFLVGAKYEF